MVLTDTDFEKAKIPTLAAQFGDTLAGPWQPEKYHDTYTERQSLEEGCRPPMRPTRQAKGELTGCGVYWHLLRSARSTIR